MVDQTYEPSRDGWEADDGAFEDAVAQLEAYFAGDLSTSTSISIWSVRSSNDAYGRHCVTIPYGETRSYGAIAAQIGSPGASRAVGLANGHNPIGIIVPCHRVIGANGSLTGYGGGLDRKKQLLEMEKNRVLPLRRYSTEKS